MEEHDKILGLMEVFTETAGKLKRIATAIRKGKTLNTKDEATLSKCRRFVQRTTKMKAEPVTKAEIRERFGISNDTLSDWIKKGAPKSISRDQYDLTGWIAWRLEYIQNRQKPGPKGKAPDEWSERKRKADAKKAEHNEEMASLELRKAKDEVIDRKEEEFRDVAKVVRVRQALNNLGQEVRGMHGLTPEEIASDLDKRIKEICDRFAGIGPAVDDAAAKTKAIVAYCEQVVKEYKESKRERTKPA